MVSKTPTAISIVAAVVIFPVAGTILELFLFG
jgi:hypothetical protein